LANFLTGVGLQNHIRNLGKACATAMPLRLRLRLRLLLLSLLLLLLLRLLLLPLQQLLLLLLVLSLILLPGQCLRHLRHWQEQHLTLPSRQRRRTSRSTCFAKCWRTQNLWATSAAYVSPLAS
jgi:hypothetical protein